MEEAQKKNCTECGEDYVGMEKDTRCPACHVRHMREVRRNKPALVMTEPVDDDWVAMSKK